MNVFWYYRQRNQSPLVTVAYLARQKRLLLPGQYAREHENAVVDGADAFATVVDVDAAMQRGWTEQATAHPDLLHEHFWDLGSVHDPTVGGCGHSEHGVVYVDTLQTFQGSHESPVLFAVIKQAIIALAERFPPKRIRVESWQGLTIAQELKGLGLPVEVFTPTAKSNADEWPVLAQRLSARTLVLFPHARLRDELLSLTYEVGPSGLRVIDKGKVHQDHAVVVRGICAGLSGPSRSLFAFTSDGVTISADPEPSPVDRVMEGTADLAMRVVDTVRDAGQRLRSAITTTVEQAEATVAHVTREPQLVPHPENRDRTVQEIAAMRRSWRSKSEQARLDSWCQSQQPRNEIEAEIAAHGAYFPQDQPTSLISFKTPNWQDKVAAKYRRCR